MSLHWQQDPDTGSDRYQRVRFSTTGSVELSAADVARSLDELVELVLGRLEEYAPDHPRTVELRAHWQRGRDESNPDFKFARLLGRLGVVESDLTPAEAQGVLSIAAEEEDPVVDGLIDLSAASVDPSAFRQAVLEVREATLNAEDESSDLRAIRRKLPRDSIDDTRPWEVGWRQAEQLRNALKQPADSPWNPPADWLPGSLALTALPTAGDESVIAWADGKRVLRSTSPATAAFRDLRDTWPALFSRNGAVGTLVLSSGLAGSTPIANAFAAELLAPQRAVSDALGTRDWIDLNDIQQIASDLKAPFLCVLHQVENRHLARVEKD